MIQHTLFVTPLLTIYGYLGMWTWHFSKFDATGRYDKWITLAIIIVASVATMFLLRWLTGMLMQHIIKHRKTAFLNDVYREHLIPRLLWLIPPSSLHIALPIIFEPSGNLYTITLRICTIVIVCITVNIINATISVLWNTFYSHSKLRNRPMKGIIQIIHGIIIALGIIISVSILFNRSPTVLITGLGAFAAVLMLIFKDTILGFVAGIQLAQYDMVRNNDWITIPGTIVNGVVIDVSLNTVKVRNYDNTTIMLPPYTLISQPIQNWRGMKESGGRRIMQSIVIDINSIQFCTPTLIEQLSAHETIKEYITDSNMVINYAPDQLSPKEALDNTQIETNLGLFRSFLYHYLSTHPDIQHEGYTLMVRTLEPTPNGIPLQIYCFTNTTHWESYETIQSQLVEYITAILPLFELYPFQNASGRDYIAQSLISRGYKTSDAINF